MGEGIGESRPLLIKDYFNELFNYALSIGMTPSQFWDEDVMLLNNYFEAEKIRQERANTEAWLHGLYVYIAIGRCFAKKPQAYLTKPVAITQDEIDRRNNETLLKLREELIAEAKKGQ